LGIRIFLPLKTIKINTIIKKGNFPVIIIIPSYKRFRNEKVFDKVYIKVQNGNYFKYFDNITLAIAFYLELKYVYI
jgi:hypothetical protein